MQISNQNAQSSINSILSSIGGSDANNLEIQDPNSQNENATLKGSAAAKMIVSKTSLGKKSLSFGTRDFISELENSITQGSGTTGDNHQDTENFTFDPTKGGQSEVRVITIKEALSNEEAKVYDEKIKEIRDKGIVTSKHVPYVANFPQTNVSLKATAARDLPSYVSQPDFNFAKFNGQTVLPCASLMELLLVLDSKIVIKGDFSLDRGALISGGKAVVENATLNDHSTGRGIDIGKIGPNDSEIYSTWAKNIDINRKAFLLLLDTLNAIDESILPDLIVFDDRLATEFGMVTGKFDIDNREVNLNGILQKQYPKLRKINFHPDSGHQDHFHIAFSPQRAGTYQDYVDYDYSSSGSSTDFDGVATGESTATSEIFRSYINSNEKIKNRNALYKALIDYGGFRPESAAIFMMIAERESNIGADSFNGNIGTRDYSIGLWQTNFYGVSAFIERDIEIPVGTPGGITKKKYKAYKLLFKDHDKFSPKIVGKDTAIAKMEELTTKGKAYSDPILWTPIAQIAVLKMQVQNYINNKGLNRRGWYYSPWGEYGGGPEYGWITKLKFKTAVEFYVKNNPGKTEEDLKKHCRPFIENMENTAGKTVYNQWLNGQVFG